MPRVAELGGTEHREGEAQMGAIQGVEPPLGILLPLALVTHPGTALGLPAFREELPRPLSQLHSMLHGPSCPRAQSLRLRIRKSVLKQRRPHGVGFTQHPPDLRGGALWLASPIPLKYRGGRVLHCSPPTGSPRCPKGWEGRLSSISSALGTTVDSAEKAPLWKRFTLFSVLFFTEAGWLGRGVRQCNVGLSPLGLFWVLGCMYTDNAVGGGSKSSCPLSPGEGIVSLSPP